MPLPPTIFKCHPVNPGRWMDRNHVKLNQLAGRPSVARAFVSVATSRCRVTLREKLTGAPKTNCSFPDRRLMYCCRTSRGCSLHVSTRHCPVLVRIRLASSFVSLLLWQLFKKFGTRYYFHLILTDFTIYLST